MSGINDMVVSFKLNNSLIFQHTLGNLYSLCYRLPFQYILILHFAYANKRGIFCVQPHFTFRLRIWYHSSSEGIK